MVVLPYEIGKILAGPSDMKVQIIQKSAKNPLDWLGLAAEFRSSLAIFYLILKSSTFPNLSIIWYCAYLAVGCSDKVNTFKREDLDAFLSQYDPAMKTKRNELVQNLALNREQVGKLNALKNSYKYEKTKQFVGKQADALQLQGQGLEKLLNEIDASIEISIAAKEMNSADAGGLKSSESQELLRQAETLIQQSKALSDDVGMLFSVRQPEDPPPRTMDTSANAGSAPPSSSNGDSRITPSPPPLQPLVASSGPGPVDIEPPLTAMQGERFPETRANVVNAASVFLLSTGQLRYAINEMFARHGATFDDPAIASAFRDKPWYFARADLSLDQIAGSLFSDIERHNLQIVSSELQGRLATHASIRLQNAPSYAADSQLRVPRSAVIDDQDGWSNLRAEPNLGSRVVCRIYQGAPFVVRGTREEWYRVTTHSGVSGWIHRSVVRFTSLN